MMHLTIPPSLHHSIIFHLTFTPCPSILVPSYLLSSANAVPQNWRCVPRVTSADFIVELKHALSDPKRVPFFGTSRGGVEGRAKIELRSTPGSGLKPAGFFFQLTCSREASGGWLQELDPVPQHEVPGPYNRFIYIRKTGSRLKKHLTTFQNVYILAPHSSTGFPCVIAALTLYAM